MDEPVACPAINQSSQGGSQAALSSSRAWLELILVIFRIAENTNTMVKQKEGSPPVAPPPHVP